MAQLSSLWRDLGLDSLLRCLIGSALMWLSNQAYCCFMALQRAASSLLRALLPRSRLKSAFKAVAEKVSRVETQIKTERMPGLES